MQKPVEPINSERHSDLLAPPEQGWQCRQIGPNSVAVSDSVPSSSLMLPVPPAPSPLSPVLDQEDEEV